MTRWIDALENPQAIVSVFGDVIPSLSGVDLHEVLLNRDLPHAIVRFDIDEYPAPAPIKWSRQGYNRVQLELRLDLVTRVSIVGWDTGCRVDLALRRSGTSVVLTSQNGAAALELVAEMARITQVSPYIDGRRMSVGAGR